MYLFMVNEASPNPSQGGGFQSITEYIKIRTTVLTTASSNIITPPWEGKGEAVKLTVL